MRWTANANGTVSAAANPNGKLTSRGASNNLVTDIAPLLKKYGVDIYMAGHWHYYESLWPGSVSHS